MLSGRDWADIVQVEEKEVRHEAPVGSGAPGRCWSAECHDFIVRDIRERRRVGLN